MTPHQLLRATCRSDGRSITANPWAVTIDGASYACATDGYRALYIIDPEPLYPPASDATLFARILRHAPLYGAHDHEFARAELLAAIGDGKIIDWGQECTRCAGTGELRCNLGEDHDCPDCDGHRTLSSNRYSSLSIDIIQTAIGQQTEQIDAQLLRGLFQHLHGDPIGVAADPGSAIYFLRPEWVLAVATLSTGPIDPLPPHIQARPVSPPSPEAAP